MARVLATLLVLVASLPSPAAAAELVADLEPGRDGILFEEIHSVISLGDRALVTVDELSSGTELWVSDGTPAGTQLGGHFRVEATWRDFQGDEGRGQAVALTGDTGYFWFFDQANVEVVLKVLDGRGVNDRFWVFYGALSSVDYTLTVTDTQTGQVRTYQNPPGRLASVADTDAF